MIETRLMQYFLAVAKEQNITKAAKVLHITQPTLSRQMAMLEKEIGATLFIKGSRPLSLTNEGYLLRRRAEEVLDLLAKTEAEVSCGKEELEGTVTIEMCIRDSSSTLSSIMASLCTSSSFGHGIRFSCAFLTNRSMD